MLMGLIIQGLGSTGLFTSRTFLPAFAAALVMRYGPEFGLINDWGLLGFLGITSAPTWFTSDWCVLLLGGLAVLEVMATKNPDARALLQEIDQYAKPAMAMLAYLGVASAADSEFVKGVVPAAAGLRGEMVLAPMVGAGTYFLASSRAQVLNIFTEADEDDDAGIQSLFSWAEDLWSFFGAIFLILFPILMISLILFVIVVLVWMRRRAAIKEERSKVACAECGEEMYRCATACPHCKHPNAEVYDVTWLGASHEVRRADLASHPYRLAAARRCPVCATRLSERRPDQTCEACGHEMFADPTFAKAYVDRVAARLPGVLILCALFSLIPIIGLIPGVILYRMTLTAPLRRYIPWARGFVVKWGVRILFVFLIAMQWVPVAGMVTVPIMALVSFIVYRGVFVGLIEDRVQNRS